MAEISERNLQVMGLKAKVYSTGEAGTPVVLLHGGGTDSAMLSWRLLMPALARDHRIIAPDWPGYGGSEVFKEGYSFPQMRAWLEDLLDQWGAERVDLVGISMGGGSALTFALDRPERVRRLVLADSYGLADRVAFHRLSYWFVRAPWLNDWSWAVIRRSRWMARWTLAGIFADGRNISDELAEEVYQAVQNRESQRSFARFQAAEMLPNRLRTCYRERLGEISIPTLIVHGERDTLVPLSASQEAARRIPGAQLAVIPGAGHWPMREKPEQFNKVVVDFLKQE